jgi:hypothetical protein
MKWIELWEYRPGLDRAESCLKERFQLTMDRFDVGREHQNSSAAVVG